MTNDPNIISKSYKTLDSSKLVQKNPQIFDKTKLLTSFEKTNKVLRENDNVLTDNYYDNIINECVLDAAAEIMEKER